ncbi:MAG: aminoglycoside phosphotransferase family protein, partial [Clostridia bacterium]
DIEGLMNNVVSVCEFVKKKVIARGGDVNKECLNIIKTVDGKSSFKCEDGDYWRCTVLIEDGEAYENAVNGEVFEMTGKAFGEFLYMLEDFPVDSLCEVIPNFHNTPDRFEKFKIALKENISKRKRACKPEVEFAFSCEKYVGKIVKMLASGEIPTRVTHNDTKINNLLVDRNTGKALCVIDLDTIMKGSLLYDFGDGIRSGCNTALEDEPKLDLVHFDMEMYEHFTKGFVEGVGKSLTQVEKDHLAYGAMLITFECGVRFLTDFLNGDVYFKTSYPEHNLIRCRTQFKLVKEMIERREEMEAIAKKY